jgi:Skp family chaperone for outer membrane proteins
MKRTLLLAAAGLAFAATTPAQAAKPAPAAAAAPAAAPAGTGIAVSNLEWVVANSAAFKVAQAQRPVTYKAQLDQAEARRAAITAQLQPLVEKFKKDQAAGVPQAQLESQAQTLRQIQESGNQELQRILLPVSLSEAYVQEQINEKLSAAVQSAMTKNGIGLLLNPQATLAVSKSFALDQAILNELNATLPSAQLVPPAGWEPAEVRQQKAAQAAQASRGTAGDGR